MRVDITYSFKTIEEFKARADLLQAVFREFLIDIEQGKMDELCFKIYVEDVEDAH